MDELREKKPLNIGQIEAVLPHRHPFLLVDRILDHEPGEFAIGQKCVSANEAFFAGHFPQYKVMPGVLILEALAQAGAVSILSMPENTGKLVFFGGVKNARFRRQVVPGDVLTLECRIIKSRAGVGVGSAVATVDGERACEAELIFAVK